MPQGIALRAILAAESTGGGNGGTGGYSYYASITIDHTKVPSDQSNVPIVVSGTYDGTGGEPDIRTTANGGNVENTANGGASGFTTVPADLVFCTDQSDPANTLLDFEIDDYDATTGEIVAHVEVPSLSSSVDTIIYMVYGDNTVTASQENVSGVWDADYENVLHLTSPGFFTLDTNPMFSPDTNDLGPSIVEAADGTIYLFYNNDKGSGRDILYATASSIDGSFTAQGTALSLGGGSGEWDEEGGFTHCVLRDVETGVAATYGEEYYLFYCGKTPSGDWKIGFATADSLDGTWTRNTTDSPCLEGTATEWDANGVGQNGLDVFVDNGTYTMLYHGDDGAGNHQIGLATSNDLVSWSKSGSNPIIDNTEPYEDSYSEYPSVWLTGSEYVVIYTCGNTGLYQEMIALATGDSLTNLTKSPRNPIATPRESWESGGVSDCRLYRDTNTDYIIYEGEDGGSPNIYAIGRIWCGDITEDVGASLDSAKQHNAASWLADTGDFISANLAEGFDVTSGSEEMRLFPDFSTIDGADPRTISFWLKPDTVAGSFYMPVSYGGDANDRGFTVELGDRLSGYSNTWNLNVHGPNSYTTHAEVTTSWQKADYVYTGTHVKIYIDGVLQDLYDTSGNSEDGAVTLNTYPGSFSLGRRRYSTACWFDGAIDEVRISSVERDADWLTVQYNTQSDPSTFYTIGSETAV